MMEGSWLGENDNWGYEGKGKNGCWFMCIKGEKIGREVTNTFLQKLWWKKYFFSNHLKSRESKLIYMKTVRFEARKFFLFIQKRLLQYTFKYIKRSYFFDLNVHFIPYPRKHGCWKIVNLFIHNFFQLI